VLSRDHENVGRRLGIDIPKGNESIVLPDNVGRHFTLADLAEQTVGHHSAPQCFFHSVPESPTQALIAWRLALVFCQLFEEGALFVRHVRRRPNLNAHM
jgi:hypothetical protein